MLTCQDAETQVILIPQVILADRFWLRLKGLLGKKDLPPDQALLIIPCNSVHTLGMCFEIGVVFLNASGKILHILPKLPPQRFSPIIRGAKQVLELHPDTLANLEFQPGQHLNFSPH